MSNLDDFANKTSAFLNHKTTLILMTLGVSLCTSTFAASYGFNYNWQYGVLFFIALAALTFHFSKFFPAPVIAVLRFYTIAGLLLATIMVGIGAWLSAATKQADNELTTLNQQIEAVESQISRLGLHAGVQRVANHITRSDDTIKMQTALSNELNDLYEEKKKLTSNTRSYEVGDMAIFGHIAKFTGWSQEKVDLIVMWFIVSVFAAMELTLGWDIHRKK